ISPSDEISCQHCILDGRWYIQWGVFRRMSCSTAKQTAGPVQSPLAHCPAAASDEYTEQEQSGNHSQKYHDVGVRRSPLATLEVVPRSGCPADTIGPFTRKSRA